MKINDVYNEWLTTGGIFTDLEDFNVPWSNTDDAINLDFTYHGTHSGQKTVSPLIREMLRADNTQVLSLARRAQLAKTIYQLFSDKWSKLWETLFFEYDPITNYDMLETTTITGSNSESKSNTGTQTNLQTGTQTTHDTGTQTIDHEGTQDTTHTGTQEIEHEGTQGLVDSNTSTTSGTSEDTISGFNSSTMSADKGNSTSATTTNSASSTRTDNLSDTRTDNLTESREDDLTDTRTDNLTSQRTDNLTNQRTDNLTETGSGTHTETQTLTRSGNIGVMTTQDMIVSQRDVSMFNVFYAAVFADIDNILTIATY